jgi:hypothetical protein
VGYKLLHPWIVGTQPARAMVRSFRVVSLLSLLLGGGLLYAFLRRLGHGEIASLLGVFAYAASDPALESVRVPFLGEPVALWCRWLSWSRWSRARVCPCWHSSWPLVPTRRSRRRSSSYLSSSRAALVKETRAPSVRWPWSRCPPSPSPWLCATTGRRGSASAARARRALAREALKVFRDLVGDDGSAAAGGCCRWPSWARCARRRPYLARYGYVIGALLAVSLTAWWNVPAPQAVPLFSVNTRRILIYVAVLIPLALIALDRVVAHMREPAAPSAPRRWPNVMAGAPPAPWC